VRCSVKLKAKSRIEQSTTLPPVCQRAPRFISCNSQGTMIHNDAYGQEHTMSPANFGRRDSRLVLSQEMEREGQGSRAEAAPDLVLRNGLTARQIPAAPASHHGMGAVPPGRRSGNVQPTTSYCTFVLRGQRFSILSNATHEAKSCESRRKPSLLSRTRPMWGVLA
jgi:hypothetical protein